jgi:hypothetical protein
MQSSLSQRSSDVYGLSSESEDDRGRLGVADVLSVSQSAASDAGAEVLPDVLDAPHDRSDAMPARSESALAVPDRVPVLSISSPSPRASPSAPSNEEEEEEVAVPALAVEMAVPPDAAAASYERSSWDEDDGAEVSGVLAVTPAAETVAGSPLVDTPSVRRVGPMEPETPDSLSLTASADETALLAALELKPTVRSNTMLPAPGGAPTATPPAVGRSVPVPAGGLWGAGAAVTPMSPSSIDSVPDDVIEDTGDAFALSRQSTVVNVPAAAAASAAGGGVKLQEVASPPPDVSSEYLDDWDDADSSDAAARLGL